MLIRSGYSAPKYRKLVSSNRQKTSGSDRTVEKLYKDEPEPKKEREILSCLLNQGGRKLETEGYSPLVSLAFFPDFGSTQSLNIKDPEKEGMKKERVNVKVSET